MRKLVLLFVSAIAFFFIAAPIYVKYETRGLTINGRNNPFGQAVLINGNTWAVPVDQFLKAFGGTLTMEQAGFQMKGNSLWTITFNNQTDDHKHKMDQVAIKMNDQAAGKMDQTAVKMDQTAIKGKTTSMGGVFFVRKAGEKIGDIIPFQGRNYIAVSDVARAFGTTFTAPAGNLASTQAVTGSSFTPPAGNLAPAQALTLNFAISGNGALGVH